MDQLSLIQKLAVWVMPVLLAITVHEVAHGWMALRLGDRTALMLGRLTLNPIKHIDPIGTILLPALMLLIGGFVFGWAKPVPITWENLRHPKRDMALVALAGPTANLLMAVLWLLVVKLGMLVMNGSPWLGQPLIYMG
ncbi:MAG: site-2 protease family protein, partial [Alphaproteobacteria bacterium]